MCNISPIVWAPPSVMQLFAMFKPINFGNSLLLYFNSFDIFSTPASLMLQYLRERNSSLKHKIEAFTIDNFFFTNTWFSIFLKTFGRTFHSGHTTNNNFPEYSDSCPDSNPSHSQRLWAFGRSAICHKHLYDNLETCHEKNRSNVSIANSTFFSRV